MMLSTEKDPLKPDQQPHPQTEENFEKHEGGKLNKDGKEKKDAFVELSAQTNSVLLTKS